MSQYISDYIGGKPFGDGADGTLSVTSDSTISITRQTCSGTSGTKTLNLGGSAFSNGDLIFIHQYRGTGVGQCQFNKITSGGGSNSLTLQGNLDYTYTTSGASVAQVVKVPRYVDFRIYPGITYTLPSWDGSSGGLFPIAVRSDCLLDGTFYGKGTGYRGGSGNIYAQSGYQGEGTIGTGIISKNANGNAGGGGTGSNNGGSGGGGGSNATVGPDGVNDPDTSGPGLGATLITGNASLTNLVPGGAGGGAGADDAQSQSYFGDGGNGGGIIWIIAYNFVLNGGINCNGNDGYGAFDQHGGGGAGGSVRIDAYQADLGTNLITVAGGVGGQANPGVVHQAGDGRIHLNYYKSYSGSASPAIDVSQDLRLKESAKMFQIMG